MKKRRTNCIVAGGYIRSCITGEPISDVDVFAPSKDLAENMAQELEMKDGRRIISTDNAFTVVGTKPTIQFIHRWTFEKPEEVIASFDYTICMAAFWYDQNQWHTICSPKFYPDLAAKRLVYTSPIREEAAGGSIIRVLKYYQRGYRIPLNSFGAVIARLVMAVDFRKIHASGDESEEEQLTRVITGMLHEVDPNIAFDRMPYYPGDEEIDVAISDDQEVAEEVEKRILDLGGDQSAD